MGHIFISYSHRDTSYAHGLAKNLQSIGFQIWIDERLDYGSQWPREIQKQLDACDAFILIMTPRSFASDWVQSELQRAKRKLKPIFPLLLEGDEPWLSVESTQFYDVRGGGYPDSRFYSALKRVATPTPHAPSPLNPKRLVPTKPTPAPKARFKTETVVALIGALATVCAALLGVVPYLRDWILPQTPDVAIILSLTPAGNAALLPVATTSVPEPDFTLTPTFPVTEAITLTYTLIPSETATSTTTETLIPTETVVPTMSPVALVPSVTAETSDVEMVHVPEGEFIMGFKGNPQAPKHMVPLGSFYIDKYEVTNEHYKACVDVNVCPRPSNPTAYNDPLYANHPVVFVTWKQAKTYCEWRGARLPTEAEWEKAARGTEERNYPWGDGIDCTLANYSECKRGIEEVGSYEAGKSKYSIYDLAGNVSEWVSSLFIPYPYRAYDGREDPEATGNRVLRGGNWNLGKNLLFTWYRNEADPKLALDRIGFRCARDATP
jgi:formylglycine-generating enzyme required for sulfatase activity